MKDNSVRWSMGVSLVVLLTVLVLQEPAAAQSLRRGGLAVTSSAARATKISSAEELNVFLAKSLVVNYTDSTERALTVVVGSVAVGPDGRRLSECLSSRLSIAPGAQLRLSAVCGSGGFLTESGATAMGKVEIGATFVVNHEEQYLAGSEALAALGKTAAEQARRRGVIVLAVGAFPVDRASAARIDTRAVGYPCVKY